MLCYNLVYYSRAHQVLEGAGPLLKERLSGASADSSSVTKPFWFLSGSPHRLSRSPFDSFRHPPQNTQRPFIYLSVYLCISLPLSLYMCISIVIHIYIYIHTLIHIISLSARCDSPHRPRRRPRDPAVASGRRPGFRRPPR